MFAIYIFQKMEVTPTRCWASYSNGFCFRNMIPNSFDYLIYPYYPAYTMGCYQIVISHDNGSKRFAIVLVVYNFNDSTKGGEMQLHPPPFTEVSVRKIMAFLLLLF